MLLLFRDKLHLLSGTAVTSIELSRPCLSPLRVHQRQVLWGPCKYSAACTAWRHLATDCHEPHLKSRTLHAPRVLDVSISASNCPERLLVARSGLLGLTSLSGRFGGIYLWMLHRNGDGLLISWRIVSVLLVKGKSRSGRASAGVPLYVAPYQDPLRRLSPSACQYMGTASAKLLHA